MISDQPKCYARSPNGLHACELAPGHSGKHEHPAARASWDNVLELANEDAELGALRACVRNLDGLEQEAIERVIWYLQTRFVDRKGSSRS